MRGTDKMTRHLAASINNRGTTVCTKSTKALEELGETMTKNSQTVRTRRTTECGGQAPTRCPFFFSKKKKCIHAAHPAQTRTLINITMKKTMVGDVLGLLCSVCIFVLTFSTPLRTRRNGGETNGMLRHQIYKTAATGLSSNNVIFTSPR